MPESNITLPSLYTFLEGLIDYAGLFPPAGLPLPDALDNYSRYRQQAENWMLDRFIIPAGRLPELDAHAVAQAELFSESNPFSLAITGRGGDDPATFLQNLALDLQAITALRAKYGPRVEAGVYEVRLPQRLFDPIDAPALQALLNDVDQLLAEVGELRPYYEMPLSPTHAGWEDGVRTTTQVIALHNRSIDTSEVLPAGFKLRCGGVTTDAFPSPAQLALALVESRNEALLLKCTAGLHHPVRHDSQEVGTKMHGFLNLFGAGILAAVHVLDQGAIQTILEDEDPAAFTFAEDVFAWRDLAASTADIEALRRTWLVGYGSCSFDEPRQDLHALGWL